MASEPRRPHDHRHSRTALGREPSLELEALEVAVLIPCCNEEITIGKVVREFRAALPRAVVYVYNNNSADRTVDVARAAGAVVRDEVLQGKGNVVRRMFGDVDADIYVLVDGDDTYDAASAPMLIRTLVEGQFDMVNAARLAEVDEAFRHGHRLGNLVLTRMVGMIFSNRLNDMLSGYRVLSRRFVKSFPALSFGFEIETELTVHALELRMPIKEIGIPYRERPIGSTSKLKTFSDGFRILRTIGFLIKEERPLPFFTLFFVVLAGGSIALAWPIVIEFVRTGLVPRFPTAILASAMMLLGFLSLACGLILDTVTLERREMKRMWYLSVPSTGAVTRTTR
jgi:glycosyltransferase involved in cell wall biosynthesis